MTVTFTLLSLLALAFAAAVFYYYRRRPLQRLQRARSRVYCRLYSKDKYFRPIPKAGLVDKVNKCLHTMQDSNDAKVLLLCPLSLEKNLKAN